MKRTARQRLVLVVMVLGGIVALSSALLYHYVVTGGLIARQKPSALETFVARGLVDLSIPKEAKALKSPLTDTGADLAAGHDLYQKNCEVCHGFDGSGKTATSGGLYPPPLD